jgi:DNA-damage-inducible protein J
MATKDKTLHVRVESSLKAEVEKIFKQLGLSTSEAVYLFFNMVKLNKGLPFEVKIPNKETIETLEKSRQLVIYANSGYYRAI